jgi:hypothetical protein
MRSGLLLDPEGGPAPVLQHLDDPALLGGGRQSDPGARRHDHIFLASHEDGPAVCAGGDDVARLERGSPHRCGGPSALLDLHRSGGLCHPPGGRLREGGMAPEKQKDDESSQEHGG